MPKLNNARWELYAQAVARGEPLQSAYTEAGFTADTSNTYKLSKNPRISARISELLEQRMGSRGLDLGRVTGELASLAFSDITQIVGWTGPKRSVIREKDDNGVESARVVVTEPAQLYLVDSAKLDQVARAAIAEVRESESGRITVKMHPKLPALAQLADILKVLQGAKDEPAALPAPEGNVIDFGAISRRYSEKNETAQLRTKQEGDKDQ